MEAEEAFANTEDEEIRDKESDSEDDVPPPNSDKKSDSEDEPPAMSSHSEVSLPFSKPLFARVRRTTWWTAPHRRKGELL